MRYDNHKKHLTHLGRMFLVCGYKHQQFESKVEFKSLNLPQKRNGQLVTKEYGMWLSNPTLIQRYGTLEDGSECDLPTNWLKAKYDSELRSFDTFEWPGCYCIYLDGVVSYIGSTRNLNRRVLSHSLGLRSDGKWNTPWGVFGSVEVKVRAAKKFADWFAIEAWMIRRLQPRFNIDGISIGLPRIHKYAY